MSMERCNYRLIAHTHAAPGRRGAWNVVKLAHLPDAEGSSFEHIVPVISQELRVRSQVRSRWNYEFAAGLNQTT